MMVRIFVLLSEPEFTAKSPFLCSGFMFRVKVVRSINRNSANSVIEDSPLKLRIPKILPCVTLIPYGLK